jgi:hypothetical protein
MEYAETATPLAGVLSAYSLKMEYAETATPLAGVATALFSTQ